ncbi:MAG TPA: oxidoreductase [Myxococcota bacterium]|nr:oxidoreductase [Myxococcota bacterium]
MTTKESEAHVMPKGKKIRPMRGVIIDAYKETPDTWTLSIFVHDNDKDYVAGQFISISPHQFIELKEFIAHFEFHKGKKELVRAYSLTSAPHEKYLAITIKPESFIPGPGVYPPLLSPLLASNVLVGREIEFTGFAGAYVLTPDLRAHTDHAIHLVAGSGAVPSFSIIKDELIGKNSSIRHTMIVVNKRMEDIIFHKELIDLNLRFPERLSIHYYLTQEQPPVHVGNNYHAGRPSIALVEDLIKDKNRTVFFACGPAITKYQKRQALQNNEEPKPRFMEWVHDVLEKLEIDKKHIKREIYG